MSQVSGRVVVAERVAKLLAELREFTKTEATELEGREGRWIALSEDASLRQLASEWLHVSLVAADNYLRTMLRLGLRFTVRRGNVYTHYIRVDWPEATSEAILSLLTRTSEVAEVKTAPLLAEPQLQEYSEVALAYTGEAAVEVEARLDEEIKRSLAVFEEAVSTINDLRDENAKLRIIIERMGDEIRRLEQELGARNVAIRSQANLLQPFYDGLEALKATLGEEGIL